MAAGICGLGAALLLARDGHDVTVLEYIGTLAPIQQILQRPAIIEKIRAAREAMKGAAPIQIPGPNRQQLLELVG